QHHVNSQVPHALRINRRVLRRVSARVPQPQQHSRRDQNSIRINRDSAPRSRNGAKIRMHRLAHPLLSSRMPPIPEQFHHHQRRLDHNRRVGHIESRPVITPHMQVNEIRNAALRQPVQHVANRPAQNQRHTYLPQPPARALGREKPEQKHNHAKREEHQKKSHRRRMRIGKHAEGHTRIMRVNEIEQPRDRYVEIIACRVPLYCVFRRLIRQQHRRNDQRKQPPRHPASAHLNRSPPRRSRSFQSPRLPQGTARRWSENRCSRRRESNNSSTARIFSRPRGESRSPPRAPTRPSPLRFHSPKQRSPVTR